MNCIGGIQGLNGLGPWRLSLNGRRPETPPHIMNTPCHLDPSCDLCQSHPRPSAQALIVHLHGFESMMICVNDRDHFGSSREARVYSLPQAR